ncbi:MAG TPA: response regulator [Bacteriovoracaceae bacterium]|nr:response regulator [Bacteriovoracaceae bacterium]
MKWNLVYFDDQKANIDCYQILLNANFNVIGCQDVNSYSHMVDKHKPHAYLLDVHMPQMDGYTLYNNIIAHPGYNGCPIVFISSDLSDSTKLKSYEKGAVDFLDRAMNANEIEARLSSKVKLYLKTSSKLSLGNLVIDFESLKVFVDAEAVELTLFELRIISCILRNIPHPLTRQQLLTRIMGDHASKPGTINTHLTSMKSKLSGWDYILQMRQENIEIAARSIK